MNMINRPRHSNLALMLMHHGDLLDAPPPQTNQQFDFRQYLPEDLRKDSVFDPIKVKDANEAIAQLGKGYAHAQRMIGTARLEAPRDDWKPEQWKKFYAQLGTPEKPEDYGIPEFKFAEGLQIVPEKMKAWQAKFQELGFSKKQASELMKHYFEDVNGGHVSAMEASNAAKLEGEKALRQEFGDKYDTKLDIARAVVKQHGSEEFVKFLGESGLANSPDMIRFLSKIGGLMLEDRAAGGDGGGLPLGTRAQAEQDIGTLKGDKDFQAALNDRYNPGHQAAVDRWLNLHKIAAEGT